MELGKLLEGNGDRGVCGGMTASKIIYQSGSYQLAFCRFKQVNVFLGRRLTYPQLCQSFPSCVRNLTRNILYGTRKSATWGSKMWVGCWGASSRSKRDRHGAS